MPLSRRSLIDFGIFALAIAITQAAGYNSPLTINIYPISPVAGHTYPAEQNVTVSIAISNAPAVFQFGFTLDYEILGNFTNPEGGEPQEYSIGSGGTAAYNNFTQDSVWIWNSTSFHVVPPRTSNITFQWTCWMTVCTLFRHTDQISTLQQSASFQFFGANDVSPAIPGNSPEQNIELEVISTIYSCPILGQTTGLPSSLPTAEIVEPTSTQSSTTSSSSKSGSSANGPSNSGNQGSAVDQRRLGFNGTLMALLLAILGAIFVC